MLIINLLKLLYRTAALKLAGHDSDCAVDYNQAAGTYDDYYLRHLGRNAKQLMDCLPVEEGMRVVDLACGTGFFSHQVSHRIGPTGQLWAVDVSSGMLAVNRHRAQALGLPENIRFNQSDALAFLETLAADSVDGVVCGWGICYMDHRRLRREIERVVRPGGFVGLIENRSNTLKQVSALFEKVLLRHPDALVKNMVVRLPADHRALQKTFCKGLLSPVHAWDDGVTIPCRNGQEVVDYMIKSGASAGFLDALDKRLLERVLAEFVHAADRVFSQGRGLPVRHESCALLATKAVAP